MKKYLLFSYIGILVVFHLVFTSCILLDSSSSYTTEINKSGTFLHGFTQTTLTNNFKYKLIYGDLPIEGLLTPVKPFSQTNPGLRGKIPFRGNTEYILDLDIGNSKLNGVISVETTGIRIDIQHSDFSISGFLNDSLSRINCDIIMGNENIEGTYIATGATKFVFQIDEKDFPIVGNITELYKKYYDFN